MAAKKAKIKNTGEGNCWTVKAGNKILEKNVKYDFAWFRKLYYEEFGE